MKRKCDHCHLEFDEQVLIPETIEGEVKFFCCKGCQGVYHLLSDEGLDSFYDKLGNTRLDPVSQKQDDLSRFDSPIFMEQYIQEKDGFSSIALIIEGIHCTACVWLNEKVLLRTEGILEADINYTNNKAIIVWDSSQIKLSEIIETIRSIGYNAYAYDPRLQESQANKARKEYYTRMIVGVFCTMNIMWLAIAQYAGYFTGIQDEVKQLLHIAEWGLATPTLFYSGWIFFKGAFSGIKHRFINMDLLVASGATLTYVYSIYAMLTGTGETYYESVTMIVTFVLVGKFFEVQSKKSAVDTLDKLNAQVPAQATVVRGDELVSIPVEEVNIGDVIELKPGEKAAIDGVLLSDSAIFDESSLTGESEPVEKGEGEEILSGTLNLQGVAKYRATKDFSKSLLHTLVSLVEDSLRYKPRIEEKANELSKHFSLAILTIALLTFLSWMILNGDFETSLIVAISVIVIACPCALALATPIATLVGISTAFGKGVLFKEARFLETMAQCDVLLLDKTGTITEGQPRVVDVEMIAAFDMNRLYSLVQNSTHPVSQGILLWLKEHHPEVKRIEPESFEQVKARGLKAVISGQEVIGGNPAFITEMGIPLEADTSNMTLFILAIDKHVVARFFLKDQPKEQAKESIQAIREMGIEVMMLTGDHARVAQEIADSVGITQVKSDLLPQEKADVVDAMRAQGHHVVMAGDGINDTLALSKSDIAIAMGRGADIAVSVSDVVVMNDSLLGLMDAFKLSRKTYRFVKQNLGISLLYNALTIPLAIAGYVIPLIAALSMSLSSLLVVGNSLRIKKD